MICMGAGTNHWFHSDETYRSFIALLLLCGCVGDQRRRLGALRRPGEDPHVRGLADDRRSASTGGARRARRRARPGTTRTPSSGATTGCGPEQFASPLGAGLFAGQTRDRRARQGGADGLDARRCPTFDRNPLDLADEARRPASTRPSTSSPSCKAGRLRFAVDDPSAPESFPRVFFVWRSNLLGSSGKGQEYFLRHLLGATHDGAAGRAAARAASARRACAGATRSRSGKLDLLVNVDFRMTTTGLYSDVVLPAATWYEKYDLSMTDMHPFVHSFNQAVPPPWEARTRLGRVRRDRARVLGARRRAPRRPARHRGDAGAARHARRDRPAAAARCATGARASASRCRARRCRR